MPRNFELLAQVNGLVVGAEQSSVDGLTIYAPVYSSLTAVLGELRNVLGYGGVAQYAQYFRGPV